MLNAKDFIIEGGYVQSGKTRNLIEKHMFQAYQQDLSIVHVLKNVNQETELQQFIGSWTGWISQHAPQWAGAGVAAGVHTALHSWKDPSTKKMIAKLITIPGMIITVAANSAQLKRLNKSLNANPSLKNRFLLTIDEADLVLDGLEPDSERTKTEQALADLNGMSFASVATTATWFPYANKMARKPTLINTLTPSPYYKGMINGQLHPDITHFPISEDGMVSGRVGGVATAPVTQFNPMLAHNNLDMVVQDILSYQKQHGHAVALFNVSRNINDHTVLRQYLQNNWADVANNATFIMMHDSRIDVYHSNNSPHVVPDIYETETYADVLSILLDDTQYKHNLVVVIAGEMAGRGTRMSDSQYRRHLTHMMYHATASSSSEKIYQAMRCFGVFNDSLPIHLYCPDTLINAVRNYTYAIDTIEQDARSGAELRGFKLPYPTNNRPISRQRVDSAQGVVTGTVPYIEFSNMHEARQWCAKNNAPQPRIADDFIPLNFLPVLNTVLANVTQPDGSVDYEKRKVSSRLTPEYAHWRVFNQFVLDAVEQHRQAKGLTFQHNGALRSRWITIKNDFSFSMGNYDRFDYFIVGSHNWTPDSGFGIIIKNFYTAVGDKSYQSQGPYAQHWHDGKVRLFNHTMMNGFAVFPSK